MQHEKKKMTRKEAIDSLQKHCPVNNPGAIIDFYIEAGMLEIVEEGSLPIFEIIEPNGNHVKIYKDGQISGISGTIINRINRA